jgi:hypothetical protein
MFLTGRESPLTLSELRRFLMQKTLYFYPPKLVRWLDEDSRNTSVLMLDIEPDFVDDNKIHLDLNIIFRSIPVTIGGLQSRDYYVGSTGARVTFKAIGGEVKKYTGPMTLTVDYEKTFTRARQSGVKVSPAVESSQGLKVNIGDITFQKDAERTFSFKFSSSERSLAPVCMRDSVEWEIALPKGEKAIRDYLFGNIYLFVDSEWSCEHKTGKIVARPSDILFFDSERRAIGGPKVGLTMRYHLWKQGIKVRKEDLEINFKETR